MATRIPDKLLLGLAKVNMSSSEWRVMMYAISRYYKGGIRAVSLTSHAARQATGISVTNISAAVRRLIKRNVVYVAAWQGGRKLYALQTDTSKWVGSQVLRADMAKEDKKDYLAWYGRWGLLRVPDDLSQSRFASLLQRGYTADDINAATTEFFKAKIRLAAKKGVTPAEVLRYHPATFLRLRFRYYLEKAEGRGEEE